MALFAFLFSASQAFAGYDNVSAPSNGLNVMTSAHDDCLSINGFNTAVRYVPAGDEIGTAFWIKAAAIPFNGSPNPSLDNVWWQVNIWDSYAQMMQNHFYSSYFHNDYSHPDFGSTSLSVGVDNAGRPVYSIGFNIDGLRFQAGHEYWLSVRAVISSGSGPWCAPPTGSVAIQASATCPQPYSGDSGIAFNENSSAWNWRYMTAIFPAQPLGCKQLATKLTTAMISMFGDMNCDGQVNLADLPLFLTAMFNPQAYQAANPTCSSLSGDFNNNGTVDNDDYTAFVELMPGK